MIAYYIHHCSNFNSYRVNAHDRVKIVILKDKVPSSLSISISKSWHIYSVKSSLLCRPCPHFSNSSSYHFTPTQKGKVQGRNHHERKSSYYRTTRPLQSVPHASCVFSSSSSLSLTTFYPGIFSPFYNFSLK